MTDPPIACTLTPAELRTRRAQLLRLADRALRARRPVEHGAQLLFAADAATEAALRELVAAEARCCPFLRLDLRQAGGALELTVTGPDAAAPIVAELLRLARSPA